MVLATKSKNINIVIRVLFVCISLLLFFAGVFETAKLINFSNSYSLSEALFNPEYTVNEDTPIASSDYLESFLGSDIHSAELELLTKEPDLCKKKLESKREEVVNQILNEYKNMDSDYYEKGDLFTGSYWVQIDEVDIELELETPNQKCQIIYGDSIDTVKEKANARYTEFIESGEYISRLQQWSSDNLHMHSDFHYYIKNDKTKTYVTNFENGITPQNVLNQRYAFAVKNGVIQNTADFKELFVDSVDGDVNKVNKDIFSNDEYYVYISEESLSTDCIMNYIVAVQNARELNVKLVAAKAAVFDVISVLLVILYLIFCGTKDKIGKAKRIFIDYLPTDIHFVLTFAASAGLIILASIVLEECTEAGVVSALNNKMFYAFAFLCTAVYSLVIEFLSSLIRVCKSEKRLFDNLLLVKLFSMLVIKPAKFIFKNIKRLFTYQPGNFNKLLTKSLIIYFTVNLVFFLIIVFSAGGEVAYVTGFAGVIALIYNSLIIAYGVWYAVQLDKIITAAHRRTAPVVKYEKLPKSLKYLVNSINYSKQELDFAVNKAVRDERMRTELITNVSHDLKTPLTSIITYVDLLKQCSINDENAKEYIDVLDEKGIRLKRLIDDLIEASKITSGVINLNPSKLSLTELAAQAVYERQQEFTERGLELVFNPKNKIVYCYADGNKTFRVIENLLSNAKKYSAEGTRVYCDAYETENYSIFEIKNISAEPLNITPNELKERFVRGDSSRTKEGNGLGLSIADNICTAQNGHLHLTIDGDLFKAQVMLPKAN